jgi:hypothetical protein
MSNVIKLKPLFLKILKEADGDPKDKQYDDVMNALKYRTKWST